MSGPDGAPPGPPFQQLRPRRDDHQQRHFGGERQQLLDRVEQGVVGALQILQDQHGRRLLGERDHDPAPRGRGSGGAGTAIEPRRRTGVAEQRAQRFDDPLGVQPGEQLGDLLGQLGRGDAGRGDVGDAAPIRQQRRQRRVTALVVEGNARRRKPAHSLRARSRGRCRHAFGAVHGRAGSCRCPARP